jgi:hypothetical protein
VVLFGTLEDEFEADEEDPRPSRRNRDDMDERDDDDDDDGQIFSHNFFILSLAHSGCGLEPIVYLGL